MKKTTKNYFVTRFLALFLCIAMIAPSAAFAAETKEINAEQATASSIITGGEGSVSGTLSSNESYKIEVTDCKLQATVGTATYKFRNYLTIVGMAVVAPDDLLHIFTLSGKYYVVDLRYGAFTTIDVWRNSSSWKYEAKNVATGYEVFGSSFIEGGLYFYERISVNSTSRERLVTRAEFEVIVNPGGNGGNEDPTPGITNYLVSFETNGGSYIASQTVVAGGKASRPTDPTKTNYTFAGWYADSSLTNSFSFDSVINSNTIVYAKWTENSSGNGGNDNPTPSNTKYLVSFETNGGSYIASQEVVAGGKAFRPTDPTKTNYTFAGWYSDQALTSSFSFDSAINSNTIVYAKWSENSSGNGGNGDNGDGSGSSKTEIDANIKFDIDFWSKKWLEGTITWDELCKMLAQYQWSYHKENSSTSTTYYFYDENGRLIKEVTETTGQETGAGKGDAAAVSESNGTAKVTVSENTVGGIKGSATVTATATTTYNNVTINNNSSAVAKGLVTYHERRCRHSITLTRTDENGKTSDVAVGWFYKGKKTFKFRGIVYKGVKDAHFTMDSHNIVLLLTNGNYKVVPLKAKVSGKTYTAKVYKPKKGCKWNKIICDPSGLAVEISDSKKHRKGISNAKAKVVKR